MQRRDFLTASAVATTAAASAKLVAYAQSSSGNARQFCEWRTYRLASADKQSLVQEYLESAAVPAWERMGLRPVGVFKEVAGEGTAAPTPSIHVLLIYPTLDTFATARTALEQDPDYQKNAVDYLASTKADPAFQRIDSWLMVAFEGMPQPARKLARLKN